MVSHRSARCRALVAAASFALVAAAVAAGDDPSAPVILIGEIHDNAAQHARRLALFEELLDGGARPALLMEQFDRERQPDIDRVRSGAAHPDADAVIAAARGASGWDWTFYRPFVALALRYDLPILAANVSRRDAARVMSDGLAPNGFDARVPPAIERLLSSEIEASHCGMIDAAMAHRMSSAQVARDQYMARLVDDQAARGVVLLAGNGHVRKDTGVPNWLSPAVRARAMSIGFLEEGDPEPDAFDRVVVTAAQTREDPCRAMQVSDGPMPGRR